MESEPRFIRREKSMPEGAELCVTVTADDMAPYIKPGDLVCVSCRETPGEMEAGLFYLDGQVLCRQYCEDYTGALHLLCANPLRENRNICLSRERRGELVCLGRLLLDVSLPPPVYGELPVAD